jgi:hypothetical protein
MTTTTMVAGKEEEREKRRMRSAQTNSQGGRGEGRNYCRVSLF